MGNFIESLVSQKVLPLPLVCLGKENTEAIVKTICALLNEQGGWVVAGIDNSYNLTGLNEQVSVENIQMEITLHISPIPLVYIQYEQYKNERVILITVPKGSLPPYSFKTSYYIRKDNKTMSPNRDEVSNLLRESFSYKSGWERFPNLFGELTDLDNNLMTGIYQKAIDFRRILENNSGLISILSELELANHYEVTNGALCLFGKDVSFLLPQCKLRIQLMLNGKTASKYEDTKLYNGNIFILLSESLNYFEEILPRQSLFIENKTIRLDELTYPLSVLREALVNALIHRSYEDDREEVTIFIYPSKIEISNPGELPADMMKSKTEVINHFSILRNPLMAEVLYLGGYMEKTGRGMELISQGMKKLGKKPPEWKSANGRTTLTIFNRNVSIEINERIKSFISGYTGGVFTKKEYIDFFEKRPSKITAQNDITKMSKLNFILKIGNGPTTKYRVKK